MKPILFRWSSSLCSMVPVGRNNTLVAFAQFADGHSYIMEPSYQRSNANHSHFFLAMHHIWENMPEGVDKWWPNIEVFRKWTIIQCGWYRLLTYTAESDGEIERHVLSLNRQYEYTESERDGLVVVTRIAKSMSFHDMTEREFKKVKEKAFALWYALTGIDPEKLSNEPFAA